MLRLIEQNQINARMRKASAACTLLWTCLSVATQGSAQMLPCSRPELAPQADLMPKGPQVTVVPSALAVRV